MCYLKTQWPPGNKIIPPFTCIFIPTSKNKHRRIIIIHKRLQTSGFIEHRRKKKDQQNNTLQRMEKKRTPKPVHCWFKSSCRL